MRSTFVTSTSYGTWLPGDTRGYTQHGRILPPNAQLESAAKYLLSAAPVLFTPQEQAKLFAAACDAATEFGYHLTDMTVESWHVHLIITHDDDVQAMVGRIKTRLRQRLGRGRIWTLGYCARHLRSPQELSDARYYIARHAGCRMLHGEILDRQ